MFVEQYLERFSSNPLTPEPSALDIGGTLAQAMKGLRDTAEEKGVELGCNIYYFTGSFYVGKIRTGEQTSINLDTKQQSRNNHFVGDFHVHPYARKMSDNESIGFSNDDIGSYLTTNSKYMLHFHFVAAGPKLWLIVTYPWTKQQGQGSQPSTSDVGVGMAFLDNNKQRYDIWEQGIDRKNRETLLEKKISVEREMWNKIPEYPAVFANANWLMNAELADFHRYGLYIGAFGTQVGGQSGIRMLKQN